MQSALHFQIFCLLVLLLVAPSSYAAAQASLSCASAFQERTAESAADAKVYALLEKARTDFNENFALVREIKLLLEKMSEEKREEWHYRIGEFYGSVPKKRPFTGLLGPSVKPRRIIDRLVYEVFRPDLEMKRRIEAGESPLAVYTAFIDKQARVFGSKYNGEQVVLAAKRLQQYLREDNNNQTIIVAGGSFVNGKAKITAELLPDGKVKHKTSDVDIGYERLAPSIERKDQIKKDFEAYLAQIIEGSQLTLNPSSNSSRQYAVMNPVVLIISLDKIILQIYDPGYSNTAGNGERIRIGGVYEVELQ